MERVLHFYAQAPNPKRPRFCFDEQPCQLLGNLIVPIPMTSGKPQREHYEYERFGVANVLLAYNLDTGQRHVHLRRHRRAEEYATFMASLERFYPEAECLRVVQDNLNTHTAASFYKVFAPEEALRLSQRFEWLYTPKHASWLNMAEIEFSALSKQCHDRRIGDLNNFVHETMTYITERNRQGIGIDWKFTEYHARETFARYYDKLIKTK